MGWDVLFWIYQGLRWLWIALCIAMVPYSVWLALDAENANYLLGIVIFGGWAYWTITADD